MITTSDLTATASNHIIAAIRTGLGLNAGDARAVLRCMWHLTGISLGEDLRGIEARLRPGTPIGQGNACFDLFLDGEWKGANRTAYIKVRRAGGTDEGGRDAVMAGVRGLIAGAVSGTAPKRNAGAVRRERIVAGRAGEIVGTPVAMREMADDAGCLRVEVLTDRGETVFVTVEPIMGNSFGDTVQIVREKIGKRQRILWVSAPEFCEDYDLGGDRAIVLDQDRVVDFFFEAPAIANDAGATLRLAA